MQKIAQRWSKSTVAWGIRLVVALVLGANLSAAVPFLLCPSAYVGGFELEGPVGEVLVRSIGLLFLMWIVPYLPAIWHPARYRICLSVIVIQQIIGLAGELWMWRTLPASYAALRATGLRFIIFDAAGLVLLSAAWWLARRRLTPPPAAT